MGFMDILSMASIMEGVFVTSQEMKETPVLGKICEMGGCIFIERRSREQIPNEIRVLGNHLKENLNIILFPEGTSGDGSRILPIKKSFVLAGQGTGKNILPVVINYKKINGKIPMSHQFRDYLCWYGDMGFGSTFWKMTEIESVDVDLVFADPIIVTEESDRKVAAAHVQNFFEDKFEPVTYPEGVPQFDLAEYLARQKAKATALKVSKAE
ncbi:MAG: lysophospholipid acyltransferase family protein, partial [Pseudobdellovibrionaceae bacterium]